MKSRTTVTEHWNLDMRKSQPREVSILVELYDDDGTFTECFVKADEINWDTVNIELDSVILTIQREGKPCVAKYSTMHIKG